MSVEEKVIWFDKWIDNQRRGEYPTWGTDQTEALADIIADWRKRGEALKKARPVVEASAEAFKKANHWAQGIPLNALDAIDAALTPQQQPPA